MTKTTIYVLSYKLLIRFAPTEKFKVYLISKSTLHKLIFLWNRSIGFLLTNFDWKVRNFIDLFDAYNKFTF